MTDYIAMYRKLLSAQVDAIDKLQKVADSLIQAHMQVEELYISAAQPAVTVLKTVGTERNDVS